MRQAEQPPAYCWVKDAIKAGDRPQLFWPLSLKDGTELRNITPYAIIQPRSTKPEEDFGELRLFYLDENDKYGDVRVCDVDGMNVVQGTGRYEGKLLVEFTYFAATDDKDIFVAEEYPRQIFVTYLYQHKHPDPDGISHFSLVGNDANGDADQHFPLWQIDGLYAARGESWTQVNLDKDVEE
ncbi:MAG: hypothetical protein GW947_00735 [Candidatus Pacebacteria bacterium]|nr:hypothetical protein [Candidatus Paceibacterota bacterium]PIR60818.1 MAG: hypothetical protein COU68_02200 [Candidatus Pacebacteria bacterium CG10_big_fil_rev_8_21_14_0_10_45_6]